MSFKIITIPFDEEVSEFSWVIILENIIRVKKYNINISVKNIYFEDCFNKK